MYLVEVAHMEYLKHVHMSTNPKLEQLVEHTAHTKNKTMTNTRPSIQVMMQIFMIIWYSISKSVGDDLVQDGLKRLIG